MQGESLPSLPEIVAAAQLGWPQVVVPPIRVESGSGGLSPAAVWKFVTPAGEFALHRRQKSETGQCGEVARLLAHVDSHLPHLVPVPLTSHQGVPYFLRGEELWQLAPWLPGKSDFDRSPSSDRVAKGAESLARLHLAMAEVRPPRGQHLTVAKKCERQLAQVVALFEGDWPREGSETMHRWGWPANLLPAEQSLRRACDLAARRVAPLATVTLAPQWIWGDAWHRNVLFEGERVSGLVDFAAARVDVPAADLARLLGSTCSERPDWREAGLAAYAAVRPLTSHEQELTLALEEVAAVVSLANWCRWLAIEKHAVANPQEVRDRVQHFTRRLARLLANP